MWFWVPNVQMVCRRNILVFVYRRQSFRTIPFTIFRKWKNIDINKTQGQFCKKKEYKRVQFWFLALIEADMIVASSLTAYLVDDVVLSPARSRAFAA
jgi:hypothetical protein